MSRLETALELFSKGYYIIPLCYPTPEGTCGCGRNHDTHSVGKAPLINWKNVNVNEGQIKTWWNATPEANIGILLQPSELFVVDADDSEAIKNVLHKGAQGGWVVSHNGESCHWYYKLNNGCPSTRVTKVEGNLDLLSGGYVVAAGSTHRDGTIYKALTPPPHKNELPQAPEWAVTLLSSRGNTNTLPEDENAAEANVGNVDSTDLPASIRTLIERGYQPGITNFPSRSEMCMSVIRTLVRLYYSDFQIMQIMFNRKFKISERYFERTDDNRKKLLAYEVAKARFKAQSEVVELTTQEDETEPKDLMEELNIKRLFDHIPEPQSWLVDNLLPQGLSLIVGLSRAGKSLLSHELAVALASGTPFLNQEVFGGKHKVLYLLHPLEGLIADVQDHVNALPMAYQANENLWFGYGYYDKKILTSKIIKLVEQEKFDVVFLDTIGKFVQMEREGANDYSLVNSVLTEVIGKLRRHAKSVVVITHQSRSNSEDNPTRNAIGSVAWGAASQASIGMRRSDDADGDATFTLTVELRYGKKWKMKLGIVDKHFEILESNTPDDKQEMIHDYLVANENKYFSRTQLLEAFTEIGVDLSDSTLSKHLAALVKAGEIQKTGSTRMARYGYAKYKIKPNEITGEDE